jgi:predicted patatin/cPLA2 family phospholipase
MISPTIEYTNRRIQMIHKMLDLYEPLVMEMNTHNPLYEQIKNKYDELNLELRERIEYKNRLESKVK